MPTSAKRIVLDTNLWISFLISGRHPAFDALVISGRTKLMLSGELLLEIEEVSARPFLKRFISPDRWTDVLRFMIARAELVEVTTAIHRCRDPKDNFLLALALDSKADFLVTGDKDLLVLRTIGKTQIVTLKEFLSRMK